ncbi:MAG: hypothetical protein GTN59_07560 [Candidatus Dadabacteria bacterium]|nr:hypothetical protein [Candidatus Dadabacteria bacterium]
MSGMFGTALNPATLIRKQWIAKEYLESDLFFIGRRDKDYEHGYKPHVMEFQALIAIIEDTLEFSFTDLTDTPDVLGLPGQILEVNATGDALEFVDPIDDFLDLIDTPNDYTGSAGYNVVVNGTEDGLEFVAPVVTPSIYEARLTFDGTNNPIESILHINDLPVTITWTRTGVGVYLGTFSATVDSSKLVARINNSSTGMFLIGSYSNTFIQFIHQDYTGTFADCTSIVSVEIKLYP